jgi:hypothetical protein
LVGAGAPPISPWRGADRSRLIFSNYGSRLDLQGWGVDVPTTGLGDLYSAEGRDSSFSKTFGGTSAAGPNVASAVASIEGIVEHRGAGPVPPLAMRVLLAETGSPQQDGLYPATERIGPRPDLRAAYERLAAPVVTAPGFVRTFEGDTLHLEVDAVDFDSDPILDLSAGALPPGANFISAPDHSAGTFEWIVGPGSAGVYDIEFTATNSAPGEATTHIVVDPWDRGPILRGPTDAIGVEKGPTIRFTIEATDPNGDPILALGAENLPLGATFTPDSTGTSGKFAWVPNYDQAGQRVVSFFAESAPTGGGSGATHRGTRLVVLTVVNRDRGPVILAPQTIDGNEGALISFDATATDPDGDSIQSMWIDLLPPGAEFLESADHTSGHFQWVPRYDQAGRWTMYVHADNAQHSWAAVTATVRNVDRRPVITAPPETAGTEGALCSFEATVADPDADPIATVGSNDLPPGAQLTVSTARTSALFEWTPPLGAAGHHIVTLTATSRGPLTPLGAYLSDSVSVVLEIARGAYQARISTTGESGAIRLASGAAWIYIRIESGDGWFGPAEIDAASVTMTSLGTGDVESIHAFGQPRLDAALPDLGAAGAFQAAFALEDLRRLFSRLAGTTLTVEVSIEGALVGGGSFQGSVPLEVATEAGPRAARLWPNPSRGEARVAFRAATAGRTTVRVYDVAGRLVRVALDRTLIRGEYVDAPLAASVGGQGLPSGIYFYSLETPGESTRGRFAVLK